MTVHGKVQPNVRPKAQAKAPVSFYDRFWRFFASVRLAIVLIFLIAAAAVLGSLIQQEGAYPSSLPPEIYYPMEYGTYGEIMYKLGFTRMYSSWWFLLLLVLFGVNLIVCSIDRFVPLIKALRNPKVARSRRFIASRQVYTQLRTARPPEEALDLILARFRKEGYKVYRDGVHGYADKGRWGRYGPYITHIGLLLLLVATLGMAVPGWYHDEFFWVAEGETVRVPHTDFVVRNDGFHVEFYDDGRPRLFQTDAVIIDEGEERLAKPIRVNEPLVYKRVNLLQASYEFLLGETSFELLRTVPGQDEPVSLGLLTIDMQNPAPEYIVSDDTKITVVHYLPDFAMDPNFGPISKSPDPLNPVFILQIEHGDEPAEPAILFLLQPDFALPGLDSPYTFRLAGLEIVARSGLISHKNLALPYIYTGLVITVFGVFLSFYLYHRRVWIRCEDGLIDIGAISNKHAFSLERELHRLVEAFKQDLGAEQPVPLRRQPKAAAAATADS